MNKITVVEFIYQFPKKDQLTKGTRSSPTDPRRGSRWWAAGAVFGLFGALVFPLLTGLVVHLAIGPTAHSSHLQKLSTISTVEVIPLLIFGGVCLSRVMKCSTPTILKDLNSFGSLCIAQFIVWRTLRRNRKEREFRLKRLSLVPASADWREAQNT